MSRLLLIIGIVLLLATEILRVYFIMPFPGSQVSDSIDVAYFIEKYKWMFRIIGILLIAKPVYLLFRGSKKLPKVIFTAIIGLYLLIAFFFNFRFEADKMFYQPGIKTFSGISENTIDTNKLVIGVEVNGEAKAYPIQIIGYHHQVRDTIGGLPVMVTYCTVCRTGRVYSPFVGGQPETFRLVGMDHFNAMFEDASTHTWWQQATGLAVAGPLKGDHLEEIPSHQSSLASWLRSHPNSTILQPDTNYNKRYESLANFDKGTIEGNLEKRDSASWKMKSWVVGIKKDKAVKAYDWNDLTKSNFIQDTVGQLPVLLVLESDTSTFHAFSRLSNGETLYFNLDSTHQQLIDTNTHSIWTLQGHCINGPLVNFKLDQIAAYQEFWHSWQHFHPLTTLYKQN